MKERKYLSFEQWPIFFGLTRTFRVEMYTTLYVNGRSRHSQNSYRQVYDFMAGNSLLQITDFTILAKSLSRVTTVYKAYSMDSISICLIFSSKNHEALS